MLEDTGKRVRGSQTFLITCVQVGFYPQCLERVS